MTVASIEAAGMPSRGEFRGNAGEYFGIWIVNILLTIITLGIYSAWAKVRRNRYFYGNTFLDSHSFDYHARGKQIFIGRLIVFGYLMAYNITLTFAPIIGGLLGLGILFLLPWIFARSLRFNARVTSYRNIHFDFVGGAGGAFKAIILGGLVAGLSLGFLAPFASRWLYAYVLNNLRYGDRPMSTSPQLGPLYSVWLVSFLITIAGIALLAAIAFLFGNVLEGMRLHIDPNDPRSQIQFILLIYAIFVPVFIMYLIGAIFYRIGVRNVALNAASLDGQHRLVSDMSRLRYFWIVVSNFLVTIITFGLMRPWAAVRERRYVVEHTGIAFNGDLGAVVASIGASGSAISAEYLDMGGFDFGF